MSTTGVPSFTATQNPDGSLTTSSTANPTTINWAAILQAIVAAMPAIMAIIAAFSSTTAPVPAGPPLKE